MPPSHRQGWLAVLPSERAQWLATAVAAAAASQAANDSLERAALERLGIASTSDEAQFLRGDGQLAAIGAKLQKIDQLAQRGLSTQAEADDDCAALLAKPRAAAAAAAAAAAKSRHAAEFAAEQRRADQARAAREAAAVAERNAAAAEMAAKLTQLHDAVEEGLVEPDRVRVRAGRIFGEVPDAAARRQGALSLPAAMRRVLGITDDAMLMPMPRVPCAQSAVSLAFVQRFFDSEMRGKSFTVSRAPCGTAGKWAPDHEKAPFVVDGSELTTGELVQHIIMPATKLQRCRYVNLLDADVDVWSAEARGDADDMHFISHGKQHHNRILRTKYRPEPQCRFE